VTSRYPTPEYRRTALAPAVLATIVVLAGVALIDAEAYLVVRFAVSILALIIGVFARQARQWWWLLPLLAIAVLWNPVFPLALDPDVWLAAHYIAALVFIAVGILVRIRNPEDRNQRQNRR
jgi:hypothetical protein